jgi:hypothetical protein
MKKTIINIAMIFAIGNSCLASTYYVRKVGSDTNNGTSWGTAWKTPAKVNTTISGGDTVYFGAGIYRGQLVPKTGTANDRTCFACSAFVEGLASIWSSDSMTTWTQYSGNIYSASFPHQGGERGAYDDADPWCVGQIDAVYDTMLTYCSSLSAVNSQGKYYYNISTSTLYVWRFGGGNPQGVSDIEPSMRCVVIFNNGQDYNTFWGFKMRYGHRGVVVWDNGTWGADYNSIEHCNLRFAATSSGGNTGVIYSSNAGDRSQQGAHHAVIRACTLGYGIEWPRGSGHDGAATFYSMLDMVIESCFVNISEGTNIVDSIPRGFGIDLKRGNYRCVVRYNVVKGFIYEAGIKLHAESVGDSIYGNIVIGNRIRPGVGLSINGLDGLESTFVANNTVYKPLYSGIYIGGVDGSTGTPPNLFKYNIVDSAIYGSYYGGNVGFKNGMEAYCTIDSNMYYLAGNVVNGFSINHNGITWTNWKNTYHFDQHSINDVNPNFANVNASDPWLGFARPNAPTNPPEMNLTYGGRTWTKYGAVQGVVPTQPSICLSPTTLTFAAVSNGSLPASQTFTITNCGTGTLNWSVAKDSTWLAAPSPASGNSNSAVITIAVNTTAKAAGTYRDTIHVSSTNANNSPQVVIVTYAITAPIPTISLSPTSLSFAAVRNGAVPGTKTFTITNSGTGTLNWSVAADSSWLAAPSPSSGTGNSQVITVGVNTTNLSYGVHTGHCTISSTNANNSPQTVTITYTLPQPNISLSPTNLSFNAVRNGPNPAPDTFRITNSTVNSGTLNWNISDTKNWLSESPTSGDSNSQVITVSITATDSAIGAHYDTITVSSTNAGNSPQRVYVAYTITGSTPLISLSTSRMDFIAVRNGSTPVSQTFQITNSAGGILNWSISDTKDWLNESPMSGNSNSQEITVSTTAPIDSVGVYYDTISVTSTNAGNSPQRIHVSYTIISQEINLAIGRTPSVSGTYSGYTITPINDGVISPRGGTSATWASQESSTQPQWVLFDFGRRVSVVGMKIYWAWNSVSSAFMCSRQYSIQYWDAVSSQYVDAIVVNNVTADSLSATYFEPEATTRIRFYQPANMGPQPYPTVVWLTEMEIYGFEAGQDSIPPAAPGAPIGGPGGGHGSINLQWNAPGDDGNSGRASAYIIKYMANIGNSFDWDSATVFGGTVPFPETAGTVQACTITGLNDGVRHYLALRAYDKVGNISPVSTVIDTFSGGIIAPVQLRTIVDTSARSATLVSTTVESYLPVYYEFALDSISNFPNPQIEPELLADSVADVIYSNLSSRTTYYWRCRAKSSGQPDSSIWSHITSFNLITSGIAQDLTVDDCIYPTSRDPVVSNRPTFTVRYVPDVAIIYFEVDDNAGFSSPIQSGPVYVSNNSATSWRLPETLDKSGAYFWRASPDNLAWTDPIAFTVALDIHAYPNPIRTTDGQNNVTFTNLPQNAKITIATISGSIVKRIENTSQPDWVWDIKNDDGHDLAPGVYLYVVDFNNGTTSGKIVVIK